MSPSSDEPDRSQQPSFAARMAAPIVYRVAVPSPLRRLFDYLPPENRDSALGRGMRVQVPFGSRTLTGWVVEQLDAGDADLSRLKAIDAVIDEEPLVSATLFEVFLWAADYYLHPVGDALAQCFPALLRKGHPPPVREVNVWRLTHHGQGLPRVEDYQRTLARAPRQRAALELLQKDGPCAQSRLEQAGIKPAVLRQLAGKGLITVETVAVADEVADWDTTQLLGETPPELFPEQRAALDAMSLHGFSAWLLQGETGSGKTEVYLRLAEQALRYERQVLVLVPEISLTPQTLQRFQRRFQCEVVSLHSGLTDRQRLEAWQAARSGRAGIVLGTRSAIFTPLARPGLIVIDEEHDSSYKQQEGFRYSARDLAVMRAYREGVPVVLGSATPSLESLNNVATGRYQRALLPRPRLHGTAPTPWEFVDLRGQSLIAGYAPELLDACEQELRNGNQVLVFLNRRGFAPTLLCHDCGWVGQCQHCDARLTVHRQARSLLCHHCEYREPVPSQCPRCASSELWPLGQGTERAEESLEQLLPGFPILRVDRDSTRRRHAMARILEQVHQGEPCILVGTQMLAKGHHFPDVTLVAIIDADHGLFSSDFRGPERLGQLITQVAGRAGRASKPGRVMIQSHHADHPLLAELSQHGYPSFAQQLLDERRITAMPPYRHLALVRSEAAQPELADQLLREARRQLESDASGLAELGGDTSRPELTFLGPLPAPMERRAGRYRFQLSAMDSQRARLHHLMRTLCLHLEAHPLSRKVRWSVDIDPADMN